MPQDNTNMENEGRDPEVEFLREEIARLTIDNEELKARLSAYENALRPELRKFANEMERVLKTNDHKGGWHNDNLVALYRSMSIESGELHEAINSYDAEKIRQEACDTANFAMMIFDNAGMLK